MAAGLWHLHAERFVHRDLAARNLLLDTGAGSDAGAGCPSAMRVKIADFGMSRVVRDLSNSLSSSANRSTLAEDRFGAVKWMAPEVMLDGAYSPASDMFSFGVVLFEIWTTRLPYEELNHAEAAQRVVQHGLRPQLPLVDESPPSRTEVNADSNGKAAPVVRANQAEAETGSVAAALQWQAETNGGASALAPPHALYAQVMRRCLAADVAPADRIAAHEAHALLESLLAPL